MHIPFGAWKAIVSTPTSEEAVRARIRFRFEDGEEKNYNTRAHIITNKLPWLDGYLLGINVDSIRLCKTPQKIWVYVNGVCISNSKKLHTTISEGQYVSYCMRDGQFCQMYEDLYSPVYKNYVTGWKMCAAVRQVGV